MGDGGDNRACFTCRSCRRRGFNRVAAETKGREDRRQPRCFPAEDRRGRGGNADVRRNGSPPRPFPDDPATFDVIFGYQLLQPIVDGGTNVGPKAPVARLVA